MTTDHIATLEELAGQCVGERAKVYPLIEAKHVAALRAAIALMRGQSWQPIETAPKDGSLFLCWVDAVRYGERDDESLDTADCSDVDFCQWRDSEHGGYFMNMMGDIGDGQNITHWQPLPAPPKDSADEQ